MKNYNSMSFVPKEVDQGLHTDLINYLLHYNKESEGHYNDIHITTDGYCLIIEWSNVPYHGQWGGKFEFVDEDEFVCKNLYQKEDEDIELEEDNE